MFRSGVGCGLLTPMFTRCTWHEQRYLYLIYKDRIVGIKKIVINVSQAEAKIPFTLYLLSPHPVYSLSWLSTLRFPSTPDNKTRRKHHTHHTDALNCCTPCHTPTPSFSTIANIIMSGSNADDSYSTMDRWLDETHVHEPWNTVNRPHTSGSRDKSKDKGGSTSKGSKSKSRGKK